MELAAKRLSGRFSCTKFSMTEARSLAELLCGRFLPTQREWLAADPVAAIESLTDLTVEVREPGDFGSSSCSVEGIYYETDRRIRVMRSTSARRTKFTALHELGHDQARNTEATARIIFGLSTKGGRDLEERVADAFAAELLVPTADVEDLLEGRQPTAIDVADLFELVEGSREACCVRMAQYLKDDGYVILAEGSVLRFCAVAGGAFPVRRGTDQGPHHLLAAANRSGVTVADQVRLRYPSGFGTPEYGGQAVERGGYVYAVLTASTKLPWGGWRIPGDPRPAPVEYHCRGCDEDVESWKRCETCESMICPHEECSWCPCQGPGRAVIAERRCRICQLMKRVDLFDGGGDVCRDCQ